MTKEVGELFLHDPKALERAVRGDCYGAHERLMQRNGKLDKPTNAPSWGRKPAAFTMLIELAQRLLEDRPSTF